MAPIDERVRYDHSGGEARTVDSVPFQPEGRIALAGRFARMARFVGGDEGVRSLLVILEPAASDDAWMKELRVTWNSSRLKVEHRQDGTVEFVVLHVIDGQNSLPSLTNASFITVAGQHGQADRPWSNQVMRRFENCCARPGRDPLNRATELESYK